MVRCLWLLAALAVAASPTFASTSGDDIGHGSKDAGKDVAKKVGPEVLECFQVSSPVLSPDGLVDGNSVLSSSTEDKKQGKNQTKKAGKSCQVTLMKHSFQNSYGSPFVGTYTTIHAIA